VPQDSVHKRLLDHLKTGVVLLDNRLRLLYLNTAAESLLGVSDRKANQLFIGDVIFKAEEDISDMQTALAKNVSFTKRRAELKVSHNKIIFVDYTIDPFEENGETQALLELNSAAHSHRINREESLHSAHITTRELVRGLAHEIKNPLGGIRGAAQLLAQENKDVKLTDYTSVIIEEADRLHNLVDRLVGSRKPLDLKDTNIHEVLDRVRSLVEVEVSGYGINLQCDYDPSIPPVLADSEQLIQAMLNIVRNAMQSLNSPDVNHQLGKIMLRTRVLRNVTIGTNFHRLAASIEVIDNGPGIPENMIDTIFYPMISGRPDGTGLGLPITHGIINQHKGMIECASKVEETIFTVVLPILESKN
tara:strand:- start:15021 stop:16103 length:1083 start_codon:yes stop_codon:yes gene_type:complete